MTKPAIDNSAENALARVPEDFQADALMAVRQVARIPAVKRIWLFGSATGKRAADWRSDIDIAVEGLPIEMELRTWSELDAMLEHPLDLIRVESAPSLLLSEIKKGILLYEA